MTLVIRGRVGAATVALVAGVMIWWLLIFGVITLTAPTPEIVGQMSRFVFVPGQSASISSPSGATWLIPTGRVTYDDYASAVRNDDGAGITSALEQPGWVVVLHGQLVRIVSVDRDAIQVDLLESPNTGGRGWLNAVDLRPYVGGP